MAIPTPQQILQEKRELQDMARQSITELSAQKRDVQEQMRMLQERSHFLDDQISKIRSAAA